MNVREESSFNELAGVGQREHYDLAIVGSGSAAFATAIAASRSGATVLLIEHGQIGGTCVNVGCIPSKALLAAAEARHTARDLRFPGINSEANSLDMTALMEGKDALVATLRHEKYEELAEFYGFEIIHGHAQFKTDGALYVGGSRIVADSYVVATGATPWAPRIPGLEDVDYLTSTSAMELDHVPNSLIVMGGNAIGLEQGQLFARLGSKVTIVELLPRIAAFDEPEISEALTDILVSEHIDVVAGAKVTSAERDGVGVVLTMETTGGTRKLHGASLLVATGRRPTTRDLGLEAVGVKLGRRGEVLVDDELRSTNPRIFAAGDVTGHPQFVYVAGYHGGIVADNALAGAHRRVDYRTLPRVTFTSPQIASVGMTDDEATQEGISCECRVVSLAHVPRAIVNRDTRGVAKIVAERGTGRVLGVHLLADGAADAISTAIYALEANFTVEQLARIWIPYLTMSEAIKLTAQSFTTDLTALSCCAL